jgi:uncharacterized protein (DUF924 family)
LLGWKLNTRRRPIHTILGSMGEVVITAESVLDFWFPSGLDADEATHRRQFEWWFRGGGDQYIIERFAPAVEAGARGDLDSWAIDARGRLALILVLDQFSRTVHRDSPRAWAQDEKALALALDGIERGMDRQLPAVWERTFFYLPLGHCEELDVIERCVGLAGDLVAAAPPALRKLYEHSASQARGHRDVIARFGRHPHRNALLGRASTAEELEYLAAGQLVHQRSIPT